MADPATNTNYPAVIDLLPEIGANTRENEPGLEHDVQHDRANAVLNAIQQLLGTLEAPEAGTVMARLLELEDAGGGSGPVSRNQVQAVATSSGAAVIDVSSSDYFRIAGTANAALHFTGLPGEDRGAALRIRYTQDATGGRTLSLPSSVRLTPGSDATIAAAPGAHTLIHATTDDNGGSWDVTIKARAA